MSTADPGGTAGRADAVLRATRRLGIHAALFTQAVADRVGLASTDVECLEILVDAGRLSAGELAAATGLTSGAATRMLDRLEQSGFVRRTADPVDRRRVVVQPVPERVAAVSAHMDALARAIGGEIAGYGDSALETVGPYLETALRVTRAETARLRGGQGAGDPGETGSGTPFAAPLAGVERGRLVFTSGAPDVELRSDAAMGDLVHARFTGAVPRVRARDGVVAVHYTRFSWLDWRARLGDSKLELSAHWRRDRGTIVLNGSIPWAIEVRGGASSIEGDLRGLPLASLDVAGGVSRIRLRLPEPVGVVRVRVSGGLSDLTLERPSGSAARLRVRGGASRVTLDGQRVNGTGGVALGSAGAEGAASCYEIDVAGGASRVTVSESAG